MKRSSVSWRLARAASNRVTLAGDVELWTQRNVTVSLSLDNGSHALHLGHWLIIAD